MFIVCKTAVTAYGRLSYNKWKYNLVAVCKVEKGTMFKIKVSDNMEDAATKTICVLPSSCISWKVGRKWYTITTADELLEFREVLIKALEREEKKTKTPIYEVDG